MGLSVLNVMLCGCGSVASHPDASQPVPDTSMGLRCDPSQPFLNPTLVPNINTTSDEFTPRLSADELEMFLSSNRPGGAGGPDFYLAKRASRDADFGVPEPIRELNTAGGEYGPFLSSDNLTLYYTNQRTGDIVVAMRPSRTESFGASAPVTVINSTADDSEPYLTQNDQVIYFPSSRIGAYDIHRSTRDSSGTFGPATPISEINMSSAVDSSPVVSADGLTIYWATDKGVPGQAEIWVATRPSTSAAFVSPMRHGTLNQTSTAYDSPGWVSSDNCVIYIVSNRASGVGGTDIWVAKRPL